MQVGFPQKSTFTTLRATELICPTINSGTGDLLLQREGYSQIRVTTSGTISEDHFILASGAELQDSSHAVLLKGDDAGHINDMGRIDAVITTPSESLEINITPAELAGPVQSGTFHETSGLWSISASDTLHLYLNSVLHRLMLKGNVYLESITVNMWSDNVGNYVNDRIFDWNDMLTSAYVGSVSNTDDIGNGSVGNESGVIIINTALNPAYFYRFEIHCIWAVSQMFIRSLTIKYKLI